MLTPGPEGMRGAGEKAEEIGASEGAVLGRQFANPANVTAHRETTAEEINDAFRKAAATKELKGVMGVLEEEWASSRILGDTHSSIVDLPLTTVLGGTLVTVAAWYDNEMGYATRLAETAAVMLK